LWKESCSHEITGRRVDNENHVGEKVSRAFFEAWVRAAVVGGRSRIDLARAFQTAVLRVVVDRSVLPLGNARLINVLAAALNPPLYWAGFVLMG
jgi:transcriptional regulator of acetoin/glycerol metabolism